MVLYRAALLSTLCSLGVVSHVQASPEQPNRVGVNVDFLQAQGTCEPQEINCDDSDTGWNIFYERDVLDKWYVGAAYGDLGAYKATYPAIAAPDQEAYYTGEVSGPEVYIGYRYPVADRHQVTARVGGMFWQVETKGTEPTFTTREKENGFSPAVGLGYTFDITSNFSFNLGYQFILDVGAEETGGAKINRVSAGVAYRFGSGSKTPVIVKTMKGEKSKPEIRVVKKVVVEKSMVYALDTINSLVLFEHDKYRLMPEMEKELQPMLERLTKFDKANLKITSHADSTGTAPYNQRLSERRADFIKAFFVERGIDASRIKTEALGDTRQAFDNSTVENRAMNRRVILSSEAFERDMK